MNKRYVLWAAAMSFLIFVGGGLIVRNLYEVPFECRVIRRDIDLSKWMATAEPDRVLKLITQKSITIDGPLEVHNQIRKSGIQWYKWSEGNRKYYYSYGDRWDNEFDILIRSDRLPILTYQDVTDCLGEPTFYSMEVVPLLDRDVNRINVVFLASGVQAVFPLETLGLASEQLPDSECISIMYYPADTLENLLLRTRSINFRNDPESVNNLLNSYKAWPGTLEGLDQQ